jgi:hypothetical protein
VIARHLTVLTTRSTMPSALDRSTPGSWEPEIRRLAGVRGFAVRRYGNRIRTHNPEVGGSPPCGGTGPCLRRDRRIVVPLPERRSKERPFLVLLPVQDKNLRPAGLRFQLWLR